MYVVLLAPCLSFALTHSRFVLSCSFSPFSIFLMLQVKLCSWLLLQGTTSAASNTPFGVCTCVRKAGFTWSCFSYCSLSLHSHIPSHLELGCAHRCGEHFCWLSKWTTYLHPHTQTHSHTHAESHTLTHPLSQGPFNNILQVVQTSEITAAHRSSPPFSHHQLAFF